MLRKNQRFLRLADAAFPGMDHFRSILELIVR